MCSDEEDKSLRDFKQSPGMMFSFVFIFGCTRVDLRVSCLCSTTWATPLAHSFAFKDHSIAAKAMKKKGPLWEVGGKERHYCVWPGEKW
jgi:hypothetical protein